MQWGTGFVHYVQYKSFPFLDGVFNNFFSYKTRPYQQENIVLDNSANADGAFCIGYKSQGAESSIIGNFRGYWAVNTHWEAAYCTVGET